MISYIKDKTNQTGFYIIFLFFITPLFILSQTGISPDLTLDQFHVESWSLKDGLPANNITSILQTKNGYLWVGTSQGLAVFNSREFRTCNSQDHPLLSGIKVNHLYQDPAGILWISSGNGLFSYSEKGGFKRYSVKTGLSSNEITCAFVDKNKNIWAGTSDGYLNRIFSNKVMIYDYDRGIPNPYILAVGESSNGQIWASAKGRGIFFRDNGRFQKLDIPNFISSESLKSVYLSDSEAQWYLASRGILLRSKGYLKFFSKKNGLSSNMTTWLIQGGSGDVWIGTFNGLNRLIRIGPLNYRIEKAFQNTHITVITEDREGSIWLGTRRSGLKQIRKGKVIPFTSDQGLENDYILGLYQDKKKTVWIATLAGLITLVKGRLKTYFNDFPFESVLAIREDPFGSIWFGTDGYGIYRYQNESLVNFSINHGLSSNSITNIYFDKTGTGWFSTQRGLTQYKNGTFTVYDKKSALPQTVFFVFKDFSGHIYSGTNDGLFQFIDGEFSRVFPELKGIGVCSVVEDNELFLWFGTINNGIYRLKDSKLIKITGDKIQKSSFFSLLKGPGNFLWSTSEKGIYKISLTHLNQFCEKKLRSVPFNLYTADDGLKESRFTWRAQPFLLSDQNKIMVASGKGLTVFDPEDLQINRIPPGVNIEEVIVDGRNVLPGQNRFNQPRLIEFRFAVLTYIASGRAGIKYRLQPLQDSWTDSTFGEINRVRFSSLPKGKYTFKVLASNSDGVWNRKGAVFDFEVYYDFFISPIFQLIMSIFAILVILLIFYLYKKQKQKYFS